MGISYKAMVQPRLTSRKCLKDVQGVMLKVALGDLLGDPSGRNEGRRDAKIGTMRKGNLALAKGISNIPNNFQRFRAQLLQQKG